jgi:hypothetical protein
MVVREVMFYEEGSFEHTDETIDLTIKAAKELGIKKVLVASTSGDSGVKMAEKAEGSGLEVIVVGHQFGFRTPGKSLFKEENALKLAALGAKVCLGTDVLTTSIRQRERLGHSSISVITQTLIMAKIKVNVEVAIKAADSGLVMPGEHVISVAGSHEGLDTSIVLEARDSASILDIRTREVIAMPLSRKKADEEYMRKMKAAAQTRKKL